MAKKGMSLRVRALLIFSLFSGIIFLPTMMLLVVGMLPSLVAIFIDRSSEKTRGLTVSAMNLAGCMPFLLQLWSTDNSAMHSFNMLTNPQTIIVMYCAAGVGYVVDWAISGLVASVMVQLSTSRIQSIAKRRVDLIARWGREVTGEIPTDRQGFPVEDPNDDGSAKPAIKSQKAR